MADSEVYSEQRMVVLITYVLHLVGSVTGLPSLVALVINYMKRSAPSPLDTHHRWMIRTFWWTIFWLVLGWLLFVTVILIPLGWVVGGVAWLWWIYRHVRGLLVLLDGRAMPT